MRMAAIVLSTAVLAACTTPTQIEGHKIRATAEPVVETVAVTDGLHENAPAWFKEWWRSYLSHAEGSYAVLALDRNGRGGHYIYCSGGGCHNFNQVWARSYSDVHYKHEAIEKCSERVREQYPAVRPDCAIYAIKNKVVWQGKLPWESGHVSSATRTNYKANSATQESSGTPSVRSIAVTWEGHRGILTGVVALRQGARSGRMSIELADSSTACEGQFWLTGARNGRWEIDCGDGLTAEGRFTGFGADKGARGEGKDSRGREIQYILGTAGSG